MIRMLFSLPDKTATSLRNIIPARERSQIVAELIDREVQRREALLYRQAMALENNEALGQETEEWDNTFIGDGLDDI